MISAVVRSLRTWVSVPQTWVSVPRFNTSFAGLCSRGATSATGAAALFLCCLVSAALPGHAQSQSGAPELWPRRLLYWASYRLMRSPRLYAPPVSRHSRQRGARVRHMSCAPPTTATSLCASWSMGVAARFLCGQSNRSRKA